MIYEYPISPSCIFEEKLTVTQIHDKFFVPFISGDEIKRIVSELGEQINADYVGKNPLFLVVLNGSFMFAADLMKEMKTEVEISFIKLASYSGTNSTGEVKELMGLNQSLKNRDVIIVEDIVDTGKTIEKLISMVAAESPTSVRIATLLLKPDVFKGGIALDYVGKEIPNQFVVGYGLDYDGLGRNYPEILVLKEK